MSNGKCEGCGFDPDLELIIFISTVLKLKAALKSVTKAAIFQICPLTEYF